MTHCGKLVCHCPMFSVKESDVRLVNKPTSVHSPRERDPVNPGQVTGDEQKDLFGKKGRLGKWWARQAYRRF